MGTCARNAATVTSRQPIQDPGRLLLAIEERQRQLIESSTPIEPLAVRRVS
jgi:hypothetical protein